LRPAVKGGDLAQDLTPAEPSKRQGLAAKGGGLEDLGDACNEWVEPAAGLALSEDDLSLFWKTSSRDRATSAAASSGDSSAKKSPT
jgi:hypothetical protein